jgi:hypothetical protein
MRTLAMGSSDGQACARALLHSRVLDVANFFSLFFSVLERRISPDSQCIESIVKIAIELGGAWTIRSARFLFRRLLTGSTVGNLFVNDGSVFSIDLRLLCQVSTSNLWLRLPSVITRHHDEALWVAPLGTRVNGDARVIIREPGDGTRASTILRIICATGLLLLLVLLAEFVMVGPWSTRLGMESQRPNAHFATRLSESARPETVRMLGLDATMVMRRLSSGTLCQ